MTRVAANAAQAERICTFPQHATSFGEYRDWNSFFFQLNTTSGSCACFASILNILSWAGRKTMAILHEVLRHTRNVKRTRLKELSTKLDIKYKSEKATLETNNFQNTPNWSKLLIFKTSRRVLTQQLIIYLTLMPFALHWFRGTLWIKIMVRPVGLRSWSSRSTGFAKMLLIKVCMTANIVTKTYCT